jgi:putative integral membrane protein (TIGR02587 family)
VSSAPEITKRAGVPLSASALQRRFFIGLARAFGGAILFALPLAMTMEMWSLGFSMSPLRLALLIIVLLPLLIRLSYHAGFEATFDWKNDVVDAFVAVGVGFVTGGAMLFLFGAVTRGMSMGAVTGMVALQAVPASIGAMLAQSLLGKSDTSAPDRDTGYWDELFHMAAGALFLAFNVAPTEEILLIAFKLPALHALVLTPMSLLLMHAFVYAVEFRGESDIPAGTPQWSVFVRFTVAGYAVALAVSAYVLWTLGRTDGIALSEAVVLTLVLGVPAAVGASAARLIL